MQEINRLLDIMARLRDPQTGCPWDREQNFASIVPYTIEEAYEVADAISRGNFSDLKDELGDLLFQVVFYAQLADEKGLFTVNDIAKAISDKMVRRHPHVFGETEYANREEQKEAWEEIKASEHKAGADHVLAGVPLALPALSRALKLQRKAARVGFDWPSIEPVIAKIEEELAELQMALEKTAGNDRLLEEMGDLLFACTNLARHMDIDPEAALRAANTKFERRFQTIENALATEGRSVAEATLAEMDHLWECAKAEEQDKGAECNTSD